MEIRKYIFSFIDISTRTTNSAFCVLEKYGFFFTDEHELSFFWNWNIGLLNRCVGLLYDKLGFLCLRNIGGFGGCVGLFFFCGNIELLKGAIDSLWPVIERCCSVLQCVAVCCSVLQCVAVCCSVLQCIAVFCSVL